jgi:hypothetical protein
MCINEGGGISIMMNLVNFLAVDCSGVATELQTELPQLVELITKAFGLVQVVVPVLLVLFGGFDLAKAVMAGKDDEIKKAQGTLMKRAFAALAVFLLVPVVNWIIGTIGGCQVTLF